MKGNQEKKKTIAEYKEREIIGGVYAVKNTQNNKVLLGTTTDLNAVKNRYDFSQKTGSCVDPKLQSDWNKHGSGQFVFEVLEDLRKSETQTAEEFKADIAVLKEMWLEKLADLEFY